MSMLMLDYQRKAARLNRYGVATLLVAALVTSVVSAEYYDLVAAEDAAAAEIRALDRSARQRGLTPGQQGGNREVRGLAAEIAQANRVLRDISVPWDVLFASIEGAGNKDVTLLGLEPDPEKQAIRIMGEARSISAVLDYLKQLQGQSALHDVQLQHHQIEAQDPEKPVRFTLIAAWEAHS